MNTLMTYEGNRFPKGGYPGRVFHYLTSTFTLPSYILGIKAPSAAFVPAPVSFTILITSLNSGMPASPMTSYIQLSLLVTMAPSLRNLASARGISSALQLLTPSAMTYTLWPAAARSTAVWVTQMCDSMPTMATDELGSRDEATAGMCMEKEVLSWCGSGLASSDTMGPRRGAFWVVVWMGRERALAKRMSFWEVVTLGAC